MKKGTWIPRNDITGKEYGHGFSSIYECQKYIDTNLIKIQMFWCMALGAEKEFDDEEEYKNWVKEQNKESPCFTMEIFTRIEYELNKLTRKIPENPRNNVIRCYNTQQKRYADGFDF